MCRQSHLYGSPNSIEKRLLSQMRHLVFRNHILWVIARKCSLECQIRIIALTKHKNYSFEIRSDFQRDVKHNKEHARSKRGTESRLERFGKVFRGRIRLCDAWSWDHIVKTYISAKEYDNNKHKTVEQALLWGALFSLFCLHRAKIAVVIFKQVQLHKEQFLAFNHTDNHFDNIKFFPEKKRDR